VQTDEAGEVEVLAASLPGGIPALARDDERGLVALVVASAADAVVPPARNEFEMTLQPAAEARIRVVDQDGEPVSGVRMDVRVQGANPNSVLPIPGVTDEDGLARVAPLPPGVELMVWPDYEYSRLALDRAPTLQSVMLEPAEAVELETIVIQRGGFAVRGVVVDRDGDPVAGVTVHSLGYSVTPVMTGPDGRFELTGLSAEESQVIAAVSVDGLQARAVAVDPHSAFEPTLDLAPLGTIIATFVGADGQLIPGVRAGAFPRGASQFTLPAPARAFVRGVVTDAQGRARLEHLIPGLEYIIAAEDPEGTGRLLGVQTVMLHGGEEPIEVRVELGIAQ